MVATAAPIVCVCRGGRGLGACRYQYVHTLLGTRLANPLTSVAIALSIRAATPSVDITELVQLNNITGPHIDSNFADPCYINLDNGTHYAFATNKYKYNQPGQVHIQLSASSDFIHWNVTARDVLPDPGNWTANAFIWSPDVVQLDSGTFVMYYAAKTASVHCIGAAFAKTVDGPYIPQSAPIICPRNLGGALDPEGFRDANGKRYLVYKIDGNTFDRPHHSFKSTPIMLQEVGPDGATLVGAPVKLMDRIATDGPLIEGPALGRYEVAGGSAIYVLFFSSHFYTGPAYNVKYAISSSLKGPYTRGKAPMLKTGMGPNAQLNGPGGIDVGVSSRQFVFHSIVNGSLRPGGVVTRSMWTGTININGLSSTFSEGFG